MFSGLLGSQKSPPPALTPQVLMWNATRTDYPRDRTVAQLFEEVVSASPNSIALVFGNTQLTYAELNARANRLAHRLREVGVGPEVLVGCCMERSIELIVALVAILKAGGAYVPLDPAYPKERFDFLVGILEFRNCSSPVTENRCYLGFCAAFARDFENLPHICGNGIGGNICRAGDAEAEMAKVVGLIII